MPLVEVVVVLVVVLLLLLAPGLHAAVRRKKSRYLRAPQILCVQQSTVYIVCTLHVPS